MAKCEHCSARILPGQMVCKACGEPVPAGPDKPDAMVGRTIADNYQILEAIGEGAMGRVYRSRQVSLDKDVAIKVLHQRLASDPKVVRRFHREARAASRLSHPNSLHIIDFGEDADGTLYIAMEYLDGDDLLTVIEHDAPFQPRRVLELMRQILVALEAAHHAGIIHRDLKPENVIVLEDSAGREHVKVCDFGIAKIQEHEGGSAITVTGFVCGTPEYMAPEQARGEELDRRADIYAAGCMLYQMLTASLPFLADSALGIITKHLTEEVEPPSLRKPEWRVPAMLEDVTLRAMQKSREDRFPDAPSMLEALEKAVTALGDDADRPLGQGRSEPTLRLSQHDQVAAEAEERGASRLPWAVGLMALGAVAIGIALFGGEDTTLPPDGDPPSVSLPAELRRADTGAEPAPTDALPDDASADAATADLADAGARDGGTDAGTASPRGRGRNGRRRPNPEREQPVMETQTPGQQAYETGRRLFLANDIRGAIQAFEQAASAMPRNPQVQKQLGRAYMRAGQVGRAHAAYRRYLGLAPNAPDRAIIERIIEQGGG